MVTDSDRKGFLNLEQKNESMLKSVKIDNFRGIKEAKVDDLALVNVFVGKNNSGKTTIMDAIYLACKEPFWPALLEHLKKRVNRQVGGKELWYEYQVREDIKINLGFSNFSYELQFSINEGQIYITDDLDDENKRLRRHYNLKTLDEGKSGRHNAQDLSDEVKTYFDSFKLLYSLTTRLDQMANLDTSFGEIKLQTKKEDDLIKRMSDIYGSEFQFEFIPRVDSRNEIKLSVKDRGYRIILDFCGDGVQRGLMILSELELLGKTGIIIEEIETYQHPEALKKLAKHAVDLSRKNKVQLFITTHNYDALRYFEQVFQDIGKVNEFRAFVVERENGSVKVEKGNVPDIRSSIYGDYG